MEIRRWPPLTILIPARYVDRSDFWTELNIEEWSSEVYKWKQDPWKGYRDFAKRPVETISDGEGDCEDYALVAASCALTQGQQGVGLGFCWKRFDPRPRHVIAFDGEFVYSEGEIRRESVEEHIDRSQYDYCLRWKVSRGHFPSNPQGQRQARLSRTSRRPSGRSPSGRTIAT